MTQPDELETLRAAGRKLIEAIDDMHGRGETFTARVSIATAALRRELAPTWPKPRVSGELTQEAKP